MKTNPVLIFFYLFLNVNFHFQDIDWRIRLKQCVTIHTIDLFFTTHVIKFLASLRSAYLKSFNVKHNFFMKINKISVAYQNVSNLLK